MATELTVGEHSIDRKKDKLLNDLAVVVSDADDLLNQVVSSSADELAATRTRIEGRLKSARSSLDDARLTMTGKARHAVDATQHYVKDNPWMIVGVAAATGLLLGVVLARR